MIYLVRHEERGTSAAFDATLTTTGLRRSATSLIDSLDALSISVVYTSPYVRCVQTVLPFTWARSLPLIIENSLYEHVNTTVPGEHDVSNFRHALSSRELGLIGAVITHKHLEPVDLIGVDDVELRRLHEFVEFLRGMHGEANVLVCTHAACINKLLGRPLTHDFVAYGSIHALE